MTRLFHKPDGVLSQYRPSGDKVTLQAFPALKGLRAVGRLDEASEGLLVVTDEDRVLHRLTTPGRVDKVYWAQVEGEPADGALERLRSGVTLDGDLTLPARVRRLDEADLHLEPRGTPIRQRASIPTCWLELTLRQGRNRQVRRMTAAVGHPTLRLLRVTVGKLQLAGLRRGESRTLTRAEQTWLASL